ncbi:Prestin [Toxocara canis]|uniref:Prestin n=1 Tax=Toxocara canis TaxID=6265 RepID=A0A0B2VV65_TOXCA|nr:Prestin [Toxocara canis]
MSDEQLTIPIIIKREVINQEDFDKLYGYSKPQTSIRQRIVGWLPNCGKDCLKKFKDFVPICEWLCAYRKDDIFTDIIAGLTVGVLSVPQAMAYASLANVNAVIGLYTSFFPPLIYAVFGTSKHITLGMFAVVALMVGNAVDRELHLHSTNVTDSSSLTVVIPDADPEIVLVSTLAFLIGLVMSIMSLLQLHFITAYLSDPLVGGFTTGAACHVFASQLPKLVGVRLKSRNGLFKLPYMTAGILVTHFMNLNGKYGVAIVGDIPRRLPTPSMPRFSLFENLFIDAILIAVVIFSVTVSVGKVFAKKHNYEIVASQELRALAVCQLIGGLMSCHPASGSLSRAVVNSQMGVKSEISSCVSALLVLFVILLIGPFLRDLPMVLFSYLKRNESILASIIVVALEKMFLQAKNLYWLWKVSKIDLMIWLVSFFGTFLWNVSEGLGIAIGFAILTVIVRTQWPKAAILGHMPDTEFYKDVRRYKAAEVTPNITIYRYDAPLLFLNNDAFKSKAIRFVEKKFQHYEGNDQKFIIIDASGFTYIDCMGVEGLKDLHVEFKKRDIQLLIASPKAAARELFVKCHLYDIIPEHHFFPSIHDAFLHAKAHQTKTHANAHLIENHLLLEKKSSRTGSPS